MKNGPVTILSILRLYSYFSTRLKQISSLKPLTILPIYECNNAGLLFLKLVTGPKNKK